MEPKFGSPRNAFYGPVLTQRHREFVETFEALSKDAQCLLIRMINRRGRLFRRAAFRYAEIADALSALEELRNWNLVRALVEGDHADFILCHAKEALIKGGKDAGLIDIRASWSKAKLARYFLANVTFKTAHDHCGGGEFIALGDTEPVEFMLYLFFVSGRPRMISRTSRCGISASSAPTGMPT